MAASRNRFSLQRLMTDWQETCHEPALHPLSDFYREEFLKCQRCLEQQREYYSERAIRDVEQALTRVMAQLDRLCVDADAAQVVSRLLRQFDVATGLIAWTDPKHVN